MSCNFSPVLALDQLRCRAKTLFGFLFGFWCTRDILLAVLSSRSHKVKPPLHPRGWFCAWGKFASGWKNLGHMDAGPCLRSVCIISESGRMPSLPNCWRARGMGAWSHDRETRSTDPWCYHAINNLDKTYTIRSIVSL